jgi:hypothetical protein
MSTLDLRIKRPLKRLTENDWKDWSCEAKVISGMLKNSGLQDKTIAIEINIDPATLSKVQSGTARLSEQHMDALMDTCGSEAWLHYWLLKRNYDPRHLIEIESELQRENRALRERLKKLEEDREVEIRLFSRLKTA